MPSPADQGTTSSPHPAAAQRPPRAPPTTAPTSVPLLPPQSDGDPSPPPSHLSPHQPRAGHAPHGSATSHPSPVQPRAENPARRSRQLCRFYGTKKGCRAGERCPFRHDVDRLRRAEPALTPGRNQLATSSAEQIDDASTSSVIPRPAEESGGDASRRPQPEAAVKERTVPRPRSQVEAQDPRAFQVGQIKKRFDASEETAPDGVGTLKFGMAPSDPDFPFDINKLQCVIVVPAHFPSGLPPSLKVSNPEMERGYQLNVERGFDAIWSELRQKTLLNAMKLLDRRLEALLTGKKAETIRIVANAGPRAAPSVKRNAVTEPNATTQQATSSGTIRIPPPPRPSVQRLEEAAAKRQADVQHLEQRLGRHPKFKSEADGTIFTVPITPRKSSALPPQLHTVDAVRLAVPREYDIEPPGIEILGVDSEVCRNVEAAFTRRASDNPSLTLLAHVNYLAQNMATMAVEKKEEEASSHQGTEKAEMPGPDESVGRSQLSPDDVILDTDESHIKRIPRPPEWDESSDEDSDGSYDSDDSGVSYTDSGGEDAENADASQSQPVAMTPRESGIMLSLPSMTLQNVELLELTSLSLTVKCERCKEPHDVQNLKPSSTNATDAPASQPTGSGRTVTCKKCSVAMFVTIRPDLMHTSSNRAGYIDAESCTPLTLLPSAFTPTCSNCSTTAPASVVAAPGASGSLAICRGCHTKMSFSIPEIKFLRVGPSAISLPLRGAKKQREQLGLVAGTELPDKGACKHYAKSFRWFRFSCCSKVYACDRCHDEHVLGADGDGHAQEIATRMICGHCSREQVYKPRECGLCGSSVTARKGRGFWEGGKGTRDPKAMSRKDPRKYKMRRKMKQKVKGGRAGGAVNA